jgi:phosphohistidine phosphatase
VPVRTLYLVRHAKSSWDDPLQDDFDRPLNKRGRSDAPRMATKLKKRDIHPAILLSSPAERATCLIIAEVIGYSLDVVHTDQRLYHAEEAKILAFVQGLDDANSEVMIFGHNPGLTDFVNRITPAAVTSYSDLRRGSCEIFRSFMERSRLEKRSDYFLRFPEKQITLMTSRRNTSPALQRLISVSYPKTAFSAHLFP